MNVKKARVHGAAISAPLEEFAVGESPPPANVGPKGRAGRPATPPSFGARLLAALKLFAGLFVVIGAALGVAFSVHRYALSTTRFSIKAVELVGAKRMTESKVEKLGGVRRGQ